ncbi:hypothetical protein [Virgibacillus sp. DJP39]|uniref:hypothetical protein n=1 Tax=Virgibacillus sp. DJP39 TaxID=3409790 RepID=UPI003BB5853E
MGKENELSKGGLKKVPPLELLEIAKEVRDESFPNKKVTEVYEILQKTFAKMGVHVLNQDRNINIANLIKINYKFQKERVFKERKSETGAVADVEEKVYKEHFKTQLTKTSTTQKSEKNRHLYDYVEELVSKIGIRYNFHINENDTLEETFNNVLELVSELWRTKTHKFTIHFKDEDRIKGFQELSKNKLEKYKNGDLEGIKERNIKVWLEKDPNDIMYLVQKNKEESVGNE